MPLTTYLMFSGYNSADSAQRYGEPNLCNIAQFGKNYVLAAACLKRGRVQEIPRE